MTRTTLQPMVHSHERHHRQLTHDCLASPGGSVADFNIAGNGRCSQATWKLAEADLARSGLALEHVSAEGVFPTDNASLVNPDFASAPALILPYHDANRRVLTYERDGRQIPFCRARYLTPPGFKKPRERKYDQPTNSGTPPYFPRSFDWQQVNRGGVTQVCLVEGEKKAIAMCCAGIPAIAIGGVYNFADGSTPLHPALAAVAANCDDIYITFDSDAAEKPQIQTAEWRLAGQLAMLGPRIHVVRIPQHGAEKVGADDFLAAHGNDGPHALRELILNTPALGETTATAANDEFTVADLMRREVLPVEELIPGWIEKGIPNFIAGPGGVHKSRLALQWGLCLNSGASIWGLNAGLLDHGRPSVTLVYCAAEDDANELARRAQAISSELRIKTPKQGIFVARRGADSALIVMHEDGHSEVRPFYHRLVQKLRSIPGHKFVVLDSAYDFVRFAGKAKIDEDAVNCFIKVFLQSICDLCDATLLIPWHPSQAGSSRDSMDGWSVAWHNAPRARLAISAVDGAEDTYELKVVKRNHGPKGQPITLKFHAGALLPLDAVPDDGKAKALNELCIKLALEAETLGHPIQRQKNIPTNVLKEISKKVGFAVTPRRAKEELETACFGGKLSYRPGYGKIKAGYVSPLPRYQLPQESAPTDAKTMGETTVETGLRPKDEAD
jgi:hypothetical protein